MLIGACGAGGTGKTTTMQALSAATGLPFIPSASRAVFARRGLVEADQANMTADQQWELQQEIFAAREELETKTTEGIADRTMCDQVAYSLLRAGSKITQPMLDDLIDRAVMATAKYDLLIFFPLTTFPGQDDGMRDSSFGLRFNFEAILKQVLMTSSVIMSKICIIPVASVSERVVWIKDQMAEEAKYKGK